MFLVEKQTQKLARIGKRRLAFAFATLVGILLPAVMRADTDTNLSDLLAVKQAAVDATNIFYPRAQSRKTVYGFEAGDNVASAALGEPLRLYYIDEKDAQAYHRGQALDRILQPSGQWFVPVMIRGTNRAMLGVVDNGQGKWVGSTFGMAVLARKWQNIQKWWPAAGNAAPELIVCPPADGYFFTVPRIAPPNLTSLDDIPEAGHENGQVAAKPSLAPAEKTLAAIQKQLNSQLSAPPSNP